MMSDASDKFTSSPVSAAGPTPSNSPAGAFGQALVPASHSLLRGNGGATPTNGTSGRSGSVSSASADLSASLANKLAARLDSAGSTLWRSIWSRKATPLGRAYWAHTASAHRTSGNGCGSWPMPRGMHGCGPSDGVTRGITPEGAAQLASWPMPDGGACNSGTDSTWERRRAELKEKHDNGNGFGLTLGMASQLAAWPTPCQQDGPKGGPGQGTDRLPAAWMTPQASDDRNTSGGRGREKNPTLRVQASWVTPAGRDHKGNGSRRERAKGTPLDEQATLASWATPRANDAEKRGIPLDNPRNGLVTQAQQTSGLTVSGSPAATEKPGQLNPAHSRWLMGFPPAWDACVPTVTRSTRGPRRRL